MRSTLVDARESVERARLLPAGRMREPWRALQRAAFVVASRCDPGEDPDALLRRLARLAPAAQLAAGRHEVRGCRTLEGAAAVADGPVRMVTATGHPEAVARTAREAGFKVTALSRFRDHHWFSRAEAARECAAALRDGARVLLTAKDAVRWPADLAFGILVLEVAWAWVRGGDAVERAVLAEST